MKTPRATLRAGYVPWCQIEVRHDYFNTEACPGIELIPTPTTAKAMSKLGLVGRWVGTQFTLYRLSPDRGKAWTDLFFAQEFTFRLVCRSEGFPYYTALPMEEGKILYLTNRPGGSPAGGKLTKKVDVSAADLLPLTSGVFLYEATKLLPTGAVLEVLDRRGVSVTGVRVPAARKCAIDVTPFGSGLYTITWAENNISSFVAETGPAGAPVFALLSIFAADVPDGEAPPPYTVTWPARSTVWRYDLIPSAPSTDTFQITAVPSSSGTRRGGSGSVVTFKQLKQATDAPTADAISFESTRPIPMRARPAHQFQLRSEKRLVIEALPTPTLSLNRCANGAGFCSRIFVHL